MSGQFIIWLPVVKLITFNKKFMVILLLIIINIAELKIAKSCIYRNVLTFIDGTLIFPYYNWATLALKE